MRTKYQQCKSFAQIFAHFRPTFKFFKLGKEVDTLKGADLSGLEAKIKQHIEVGESSESTSSSVSGLKDSVNGYPDITDNIDVTNVVSFVNHLMSG